MIELFGSSSWERLVNGIAFLTIVAIIAWMARRQ